MPAAALLFTYSDFLDVVGAGYQPGILRFGADDFVLSISIPVLNLDVPSRALVAWDRRLLSASRHLVLLVSGLRARWPAIRADGTLVGVGGNIRFHVGLSAKYKPSTASVTQAVRTFALKDDDLEAEIELESEPVDPDLDPWEAELRAQQREKERIAALPVDENAFERFSLSSSLDSLLDHQFLPVVRLRLRFGLGWAGAEMLHLWSQKMQCKPEELFDQYKDVRVFCLSRYGGCSHTVCRTLSRRTRRSIPWERSTTFLWTRSASATIRLI